MSQVSKCVIIIVTNFGRNLADISGVDSVVKSLTLELLFKEVNA